MKKYSSRNRKKHTHKSSRRKKRRSRSKSRKLSKELWVSLIDKYGKNYKYVSSPEKFEKYIKYLMNKNYKELNMKKKDIHSKTEVPLVTNKKIYKSPSVYSRNIRDVPSILKKVGIEEVQSTNRVVQPRRSSEVKIEEDVPSRRRSEVKIEEEVPSRRSSEVKIEEEVPTRRMSEVKIEEEVPTRRRSEVKIEEIPSRRSSEVKIEEIPSRRSSEVKIEEEVPSRRSSEVKIEEQVPLRRSSEVKIEEEVPSRRSSEVKIEEEIPRRRSSEVKIEEVPPPPSTEKLVELDEKLTQFKSTMILDKNESIIKISNILNRITKDKNKQEEILKNISILFKTTNPVILFNKMLKYYVIFDYSITPLNKSLDDHYGKNVNSISNIENTDEFLQLYNKYKSTLPIIAFEMYNKDESNRNLRLFYLLHLIHIKKMYNLQFLDMLINPILEIMREMNL